MTKKPKLTINDIAQQLGVSKTTVSRAISGKGRISADTRAKVMDYIESCDYHPNAAAKSLAERRSHNLMLVLPGTDFPNAQKILTDIWTEATRHGYNILLCFATEDGKAALVQALDDRKIDGVVLVENSDPLVHLLKRRQIPFAFYDRCRELLLKLQKRSESR